MAQRYWQIILAIAFVSTIGACNSTCSCHRQIRLPSPPKEVRNTRYIYSDKPAIVTFTRFQEQLNQFAYQLTLLYLIDTDSQYDMDVLRCLTDIQKRFYRYGLRVIIIDLHSPIHWPTLKKSLYKAKANYLAEYINFDGKSLLKDFLNCKYSVKNLFAIDLVKHKKIYRLYDKQCWRIEGKVKSILRYRAENVSD